jgi:hypothetical protein
MNTKNQKPNLRSEKAHSANLLIWIISGLYLLAMVWFLLLSPMGEYGAQEAQSWLVPAVVMFTVSYGIFTPRLHPNLAELYRQKVINLAEALNDEHTRLEAAECLRELELKSS